MSQLRNQEETVSARSSAPMRSAQHRTRVLWLIGVLHAFTHVYQVALIPLYLLIQRDFGFQNVGRATLLLTVMTIACFGPSYPVGVLADRFSRKHLLTFGLILNGLGFIALALAPTYAMAVIATALAGIGGSFYHPAATPMVARLFPSSTGRALGLAGIGASVGFFVGPIFSGWRAASLEPMLGAAAWRRPVLELGLLGVAVALLFAWVAEPDEASSRAEISRGPHERMFPTRALWAFFIVYCLAFSLRDFAGGSMASLGSLFLQSVHGLDTKWTGLTLSGIFIASAISNPLFGSLSDGGRKRWLAVALLAAASLVALFPHVTTRWTMPVYLVYGFFFMASYPMTEAALMESVPDSVRGRVCGLFLMTGGIIGSLAHWAVGVKVKSLGPSAEVAAAYFPVYTGLAALLVCSLLGLLCLGPIRRREDLARQQTRSPQPFA